MSGEGKEDHRNKIPGPVSRTGESSRKIYNKRSEKNMRNKGGHAGEEQGQGEMAQGVTYFLLFKCKDWDWESLAFL